MNKVNTIINVLNKYNNIIIYDDINGSYILEKDNNNKNITSKKFIKKHKILKENLNKEINKEYISYIHHFINILSKKLSYCNFDNLNNNIKTLSIKNRIPKLRGFNIVNGAYKVKENKIFIDKNKCNDIINHELLHMASTKKVDKNHIKSGFSIINNKIKTMFGRFIDEGFTEFLNVKYFKAQSDSYSTQRGFIIPIMKIVGDTLMEEMYFNGDLLSFIKELTKYNNTLEDVIMFIYDTDFIHKNLYTFNPIKRKRLKKALTEVNAFLIITYYKKIRKNNYSKYELLTKMSSFLSDLNNISLDYSDNAEYVKYAHQYFEKCVEQKKLIKF